jgi:hypothetical protein
MNKIAVFYHVGQIGDWKRIYQEQMHTIQISGLYDACSHFSTRVNGNQNLPYSLSKQTIGYNDNQVLEANTLENLWKFCIENPNYNVLYFHTKGVTHINSPIEFNVNSWRLYMEYFNIHKWKDRQTELVNHDASGVELRNMVAYGPEYIPTPALQYAGNFWWAKSSYITKLDPKYLYSGDIWPRGKSETWIGTGNGNLKCPHNFGDRHSCYLEPYPTHEYMHDQTNRFDQRKNYF